ncbi:glucosamine-6-phosphate deaminase [Metabacillus herbersteinensis]|uniref:Glucosamine-6-phosphate deaminase n=1 Tax=Metabacillus herbersteinensis TaxID=283816 RepID=A0ABV6GIM4_9BACI
MKLVQVENDTEMSQVAAEKIISLVTHNPTATLGLATGGTPKGVYAELRRDYENNHTSYHSIKAVNLDEYVGLTAEDPNSYKYYMSKELFNHINIKSTNTHLPHGNAEDLNEECVRYEKLIKSLGGIDLQLLGIGHNGHIGFNEPGTSFESRTHLVHLTEQTITANSRYFSSYEEVPKQAITMGIQTILCSKEIVLIASGKEKAESIKRLFKGEINESFPASTLLLHANVTVIADKEATALL